MAENRLEGRRAVVTGAARGIGRACATRLAELGADVAVLDLDLRGGERYEHEPDGLTVDTIEGLGRRALGIEVDLADEAAAHAAIGQVVDAWGGVDVLVNVAGGAVTPYERSRPTATPTSDVQRIFALNFLTMVHCCQAAAPSMRASGAGVIVNVSSTAAFTVFPDGSNAAYASVKAAVSHFTRHLAAELGPDGIRVNAFAPGITLTGRIIEESSSTGYSSREAEVPLRRLGRPEDCADVLEFLVSDLSGFVTGRVVPVDGGWILGAS
ncbi:SDR family NAD(P)-dependent oxidoreductase [Patulibacter sp. NPDC049589]|uniref:SDR family NAD(P)-dependent oxidoreductase n=1 Tax=Patulibacter sp. NPDC049589 TaxID=3154731 RepID=UPI00343B6F4E